MEARGADPDYNTRGGRSAAMDLGTAIEPGTDRAGGQKRQGAAGAMRTAGALPWRGGVPSPQQQYVGDWAYPPLAAPSLRQPSPQQHHANPSWRGAPDDLRSSTRGGSPGWLLHILTAARFVSFRSVRASATLE